jgi:H+/Cl- antiporter ClcA
VTWRRGLIRLWVVLSFLWVAGAFYPYVYFYWGWHVEEYLYGQKSNLVDLDSLVIDGLPSPSELKSIKSRWFYKSLFLALTPPLAVLLLGAVIGWIIRGFSPAARGRGLSD